MLRIEDVCTCAGMSISTKPKVMHINVASGTPPTPLQLHSLNVEPVALFTYLWSEVNPTQDLSATIHARLRKADIVFAMFRRIWTSWGLSTSIKATFHSLVRPAALYGAETWSLVPSQEHLVDTHDMEWIRQIPKYGAERNAQCL